MENKLVQTTLTSLLLAMLLVATFAVATPAAAEGQNGTTLTAYKTAEGQWTREYHWTIDKSVDPAQWDMFKGDSGTSTYVINLTKDAGTDEFTVKGQVCVENGGAVTTENLTIVDQVEYKVGSGQFQNLKDASQNIEIPNELGAGQAACYNYEIPFTPVSGAQYRNVAHVTITNHSGSLGQLFGPNPKADFSLPASPTLVHDSVNVDDTNGKSWVFGDSGSVSYDKTFTCNGDEGNHSNTATIRETGQSDSASVQVNCYDLTVTKDAHTSFDRTYNWSISKSADQSSMTLALNQTFLVNYAVAVNMTGSIDSNWAVNGNIHVQNPAPIAATLNSVSDVVASGIAATVDCGVSFPYTLAAGATLDCTYTAPLPDAANRLNTATATLQNTPSGTTSFFGTADVKFSGAAMNKIDECIDVNDTYAGKLGTVCYGVDSLPKTFTYSRNIGPYSTCGNYTVDNTADFITNDTGATGNASKTINVNVPCANGCTLTIGYWKNHAGFGPQADMVTPLLPKWLGLPLPLTKSMEVTTASKAVSLLGFKGSNNVFDASNGINKLYAQLLAAKLNIASGANNSAVSSTIGAADLFLTTKNSTDWFGLTKNQKNQVNSWMSTLDNFNNGLIGPGHCSQ